MLTLFQNQSRAPLSLKSQPANRMDVIRNYELLCVCWNANRLRGCR